LTTHHAGKGERDGGDVILGSTAIFGAVDTAVTIKLKSGQRVIESHQRYGNDIPKTVLAFDEETFMITVAGELEALEIARAEQAILDALDHGAMTQADIREIEGFRTATLRKALTNLHESGRVSRAGAGRSGSPFYYEKVAAESPTDGP
jgi:hypothetical protein